MKYILWLLWFFVIAFLWLLISQFTALEKLGATLAHGQWDWVLAAAALQLVYYLVYAWLYQAAFYAVDVQSSVIGLIPVLFSSVYLNVAAPLAGTSGNALFIDDARRRGESPARAVAGTLLVLVADFGAFLIILAAGLIVLFAWHDLQVYEAVAALLLLLLVSGLCGMLLLGVWRPDILRRILTWLQNITNRLGRKFGRPALLSETWADNNAAEFSGAALAAAAHPARLIRPLMVALLSHLVDLLSLFALFLAFYHAVSPGVLIAGYAMGILFWIVSITPQGIGVVEGMMTLVLASLGVPADKAAVISLSFRGLSFWLPFFIGFFLLHRMRLFQAARKPWPAKTWLRIVALLVAAMGIINVLSAVSPGLPNRVRFLMSLSPLEVLHGGRFAAAIAGFGLIVLASGLLRRKYTAWISAVCILLVSAASHVVKGLDYEEAILALALTAWLIVLRPLYHARSDPPSLRQGLLVLLAAAAFTLFYGIAGFYLLDHQFNVNFSLINAVRQTTAMFFQFNNPGLEPVTGLGRYFAGSIYGISLVTFSYAALMLIRPVLVRRSVSPQECSRARQIVEGCGQSSLAAFALLPDKHYFFSTAGSVIQMAVKGRIALSLGDPIGPPDDFSAAVHEFIAYCAQNDWQPAFYQVQPEGLSVYQEEGLQAIKIGQEAIVQLSCFTLEGRENKGLRSAYNKLVRLGYWAEIIQPPHNRAVLDDLHEISDAWLTLVHGSEKRFSLGWFDEEYLNRGPIIVILDPEGCRVAFANIVSEFQKNEQTIDLMRHRPGIENGVMDFLFIELFHWASEQGVATFDLGLSGLSGIGETSDDPAAERALHYIYEHVSRFYNFKGLHAYKEKFHPVWSPRYLVYPDILSLPSVALALIRADSGDDWFEAILK
jgi:phosphatidylglycerol lysyltransferase